MKKFIEYLDACALQKDVLETDYLTMIHHINGNYHFNNVGPLPLLMPIYNGKTSYLKWQQKHETTLVAPLQIKKKMKYIDANISTIHDILTIIEENPYDTAYEYNIDLYALHSISDELKHLDAMIGLDNLKRSIVDQLLYFIQKLHIGNDADFKHTVLSGPPGTGKTEIAKLLGLLYSKIGILKSNSFQKVTRSDLIAGYLGQTAIKTQKVIENSLGGVLFIDEAYSLADYSQNDSFSKECIDTICEALSNHKDNLMVIIAGYEEELNHTFFKANKGLESRFIWRFKMDAYSPKEMSQIFLKKVNDNGWNYEKNTNNIDKWFVKNKDSFTNYGRDMESLFTHTKISHSRRIYGKTQEERKLITMHDLEKGYETFIKNKNMQYRSNVITDMYV